MSELRPRIRPRYAVAHLGEDGVFLLSEDGRKRLPGPLFAAVVPLLDGERTAEEIAGALADEYSAMEVFYGLMTLRAEGILVDADEVPTATGREAEEAALWDLLETGSRAARERLARTSIAVEDLGTGWVTEVAEGLARAGLRVAVASESPSGAPTEVRDGALRVILVRDLLDPALEERARALATGTASWLPVQCVGRRTFFGPLFRPGEGPCWECLAHRLRANRPVEELIRLRGHGPEHWRRYRGAHAGTVAALAALLAARLVGLLGVEDDGESRPPALPLTAFDAVRGDLTTHPLEARPQCPGCGDPDLYPRQLQAPFRPGNEEGARLLDGVRVVPPEETVAALEGWVDPWTGIVRDVRYVAPEPPGPVHVFQATHAGPALPHPRAPYATVAGEGGAGGKGLTRVAAHASVLGEAVERVSGVYQGDEGVVRARFRDLDGEAIHPNDCMLFSERQYARRDAGAATIKGTPHVVPPPLDPDVELEWTPVWSLTESRHRLLPTQYLYFAHPGPPEHAFSFSDSNGNAAGNTRLEACLQGALELVERDAVGIWWYNRLSMPALALSSVEDPGIRRVLDHYRAAGRPIHVLDLTLDLDIPVYAAVSRAAAGPEEILLGFGAHFDPRVALARALTEVGQSLAVLRGHRDSGKPPRTALARWFDEGRLEDHPYLAPAPGGATPFPDPPRLSGDPAEQLDRLLERVHGAGLEMLVLDQTRPDLRIPVVKSIIPGLRHFWRRSAPGRLYDIPVSLGLRTAPIREEELNPLPMFL